MSFSILILTLNEAATLPTLLERLHGISTDIIVLDSHSDDETCSIAEDYGCKVYKRRFDNERAQRTFALSLPFKYSWVYNPDADEIPSDLLLAEMNKISTSSTNKSAYEVRFKNYLYGKWIRRSTDYPVWVIRFFRPDKLSFEREINLRYVVDGSLGRLTGHFNHYPFAKGTEWWLSKHNVYSTKEAKEAIKIIGHKTFFSVLLSVFSTKTSKERRLALKELSFFLPARGVLRFLYSYIIKLGFLDGKAGLKYCVLISFYEFMISVKINELQSFNRDVR